MEDIWKDLLEWQTEINKKDETLNRRKPVHDQALPPVQASTEIILDNLKPVGLQNLTVKKQTPAPTPAPKAAEATNLKTRAEKAEAEKAKGNSYFVKQDYKNAILYYTKAIDLDPTVSVYFVNRAMAHLKVKNYLDAEKDCTRGIQLDPKNVKALWRRGVARVELGRIEEARKDFEKGLTIEPSNKPIMDELKKLPAAKVSAAVKPPAKKVEPVEEKRRLPINVIDGAYKKEEGVVKQKAAAQTKQTEKAPVKPAPAKPVAAPEKSKIQPVETKQSAPAVKTADSVPVVKKSVTPLKINIPRTNFEFERDWKTFKGRGEDELYQYFKAIPPTSYANIFKSSLESDQFEKMIDILATRYTQPNDIFQVLEGLSQVKRIDMLVMFLSKKEQQALQKLFDLMKSSSDIPAEKLTKLAQVYSTRV